MSKRSAHETSGGSFDTSYRKRDSSTKWHRSEGEDKKYGKNEETITARQDRNSKRYEAREERKRINCEFETVKESSGGLEKDCPPSKRYADRSH